MFYVGNIFLVTFLFLNISVGSFGSPILYYTLIFYVLCILTTFSLLEATSTDLGF